MRLVEVAATVVGVAVPDAELLSPDLPDEVVRARLPAKLLVDSSLVASARNHHTTIAAATAKPTPVMRCIIEVSIVN